MRLEPLQSWFRPAAGPLLPQLQPALAAAALEQAGPEARLLRWAITAVEPIRGLRIEAVLLVEGAELAPTGDMASKLAAAGTPGSQASRSLAGS